MVLIRLLDYILYGFYVGFLYDNTMIIYSGWNGNLYDNMKDYLRNTMLNTLEINVNVTKNIFTIQNYRYLKNIIRINFKIGTDYIIEKMIIPENIQFINIEYSGEKPSLNFDLNEKKTQVNWNEITDCDCNTDINEYYRHEYIRKNKYMM